nr:hypothetical protein GCM10020093_013350 [Planobispora longispora]
MADRFFARLPQVELYNLYGPTEAAVDVTLWRCEPGDATVPIGRPVQNTALYVLDRHLRPVPTACRASCTSAGSSWPPATTTAPR